METKLYTKKNLFQLITRLSIVIAFCVISLGVNAQVAINEDGTDPANCAVLDVNSNGTKGLLVPRVADRTNITSPENGLIVYQTSGEVQGFYIYTNGAWLLIDDDTQDLSLSGNILSISDGNTVDLSVYLDNQTLSLSGTSLSISEGNSVELSSLNTDNQTLSRSGDILTISNGNTVTIPSLETDEQTLSLSGSDLTIYNGNSVDLTPYLDNTDDQTISLAGTVLSIESGNTADLASINTDDQTLTIVSDILGIETGNTVDLTPYLDNTDDQTLDISGDILSIESGNTVDLTPYLDNTDDQTLDISGDILSIESGNTVDLTPYLDNTDDQTLDITGDILSVESGNTVDLTPYLDNTDDQTISLSGKVLSIENGNSADLSAITIGPGTTTNNTTRFDGSEWVESDLLTIDPGTGTAPVSVVVTVNAPLALSEGNGTVSGSTLGVGGSSFGSVVKLLEGADATINHITSLPIPGPPVTTTEFTDGQLLVLMNMDASYDVTIENSTTIKLKTGDNTQVRLVGGYYNSITFIYDSNNDIWVEISRASLESAK